MLSSLAQEVATITAEIIGHAVLLTDETARVIGSSDPSRIGGLHAPSLLVMRERCLEITDAEEAARLAGGVRSGVTLPIELEGRVVGSIAIAGDPSVVVKFGRLVQKHAELFLREQVLLESALLRESLVQNLMQELLSSEIAPEDEPRWIERGRSVGVDLACPRLVLAFSCRGNGNSPERGRKRENASAGARPPELQAGALRKLVTSSLGGHFRESRTVMVPLSECLYAILLPAPGAAEGGNTLSGGGERGEDVSLRERTRLDEVRASCSEILAELAAQGLAGTFGVGGIARRPAAYPRGYRDALETLDVGLRLGGGVFHREDLLFERFLASADPSRAEELRRRFLLPLAKVADREELVCTFVAWCDAGGAPSRAAEVLRCHKNTLYYRLEKIHRLTGLDPRNVREAGRLAVLLQVDRLYAKGSDGQNAASPASVPRKSVRGGAPE
jgi:carbohydrate diacid regulator